MILPQSFFESEDILSISKQLLGKKLCTNINDRYTSGIIVETEAYKAPEDKASHAYGNKVTPRTKTMFSPPGTAYVYICYGQFHLFNIITAPEGIAHCILIRAVEPFEGIDVMLERRGSKALDKNLCNGPGKLSVALGITKAFDGWNLTQSQNIWLEEGAKNPKKHEIVSGPRVGMRTAEEYSNIPWRFRIKDSIWTSKPNKVLYAL